METMQLRVRATRDAPRTSRARLSEYRSLLGSRFDDVLLILSELVTNSVRHADGTDEIAVRLSTTDSTVRLEVTDDGPGFDPAASREGLGLNLVDSIASKWGVSNDGRCTVWVEMARSG